jgi:hypothetical protein
VAGLSEQPTTAHSLGLSLEEGWQTDSPESQGFSASRLDELRDSLASRDTVAVIPSLSIVVAVRGAKLGAFKPGKEDGVANQNLRLLVEATRG